MSRARDRFLRDSVRMTLNNRDMNTIMLAFMWIREDPEWEAEADAADSEAMDAVEAKIQAARKRQRVAP